MLRRGGTVWRHGALAERAYKKGGACMPDKIDTESVINQIVRDIMKLPEDVRRQLLAPYIEKYGDCDG